MLSGPLPWSAVIANPSAGYQGDHINGLMLEYVESVFFGSSRITGKDALDLHEKEFAIPVTVRHPLDDLYSIVYSFQLPRVHRPANPADDAPPVTL